VGGVWRQDPKRVYCVFACSTIDRFVTGLNTDVVKSQARFCTHILKNLGQNNNQRASGNSFNSYANLSSDIDLMNGPADVMIQTGNHEMDTKSCKFTLC
jgi:hypothetical protein